MTKHIIWLALAAACTTTIGGEPTDTSSPWPALDRIQREGPPRYSSRVHSCAKIRYATLGNLLASRGVNLDASDPLSAGGIYAVSQGALGGPNYAERVRENIGIGLGTESKLFDIFVQAAPEIIESMPARPECSGAPLFDGANHCLLTGISCLMGMPATQLHVDLCNQTIARADDVTHGKQLAVATLAAAAHTCE